MKTSLLSILCLFLSVQSLFAKTWRVNNQSGINANFSSIGAAVGSSTVLAGDTLYIEGTATNYQFTTINKRLVFIGPGYFLSDVGSNAGLQFNGQSAKVNIAIDSLASGSEFYGLSGSIYMNTNADNLKFIRCNINFNPNNVIANSKASEIEFRQCYISVSFVQTLENIKITNCIINNLQLSSVINGLLRNNTVPGPCTINNSYVSNNIFLSSLTLTNCSVKNNLSNANNLPAGNNNKVSIPATNIIVNTGSSDGKYMLTDTSPAKSAGETINGETPDAGAFGTGDPYRLSGIPPIPTIYALQAPSSVPATATVMTVTISTRSNN
jgi:hypothetical protein